VFLVKTKLPLQLTMRVNAGSTILRWTLGARDTVQSGPTLYDPSSKHKWFEFPFQVGKKWKYRYRWRKRWLNPEVKVVSVEKVTTPAGTFQAFKVERKERNRSFIYWYSPQTKSVVKYHFERYHRKIDETSTITSELVTYKVHKK